MNSLKWLSIALLVACFSASAESLTPLAAFEFPFTAYDIQFDGPRGCIYVPDFYGQRLLRANLTNGSTLQEFTFTNGPVHLAVSPNRQRLYVGLWQTNLQIRAGSVAEFDLATMTKTAEFPVSMQPYAMVATDNRLVILSSIVERSVFLVPVIASYSAARGVEVGRVDGTSMYAWDRLALHKSQAMIYHMDAGYQLGSPMGSQVSHLNINLATGELVRVQSWYWNWGLQNFGLLWSVPNGQLILGSGEVLNTSPLVSDDLKLARMLEQRPPATVAFDTTNRAMFTLEKGASAAENHLHQFDLPTLDYGSSHEVTNAADIFWLDAYGEVIRFAGYLDGHTRIEAFRNPARGGATNHPPVPDFAATTPLNTTTNIVRLDASASRDDATPPAELRFRWDLDNDGVFDTDLVSTPLVDHHFNVAGTNWVMLEARDGSGVSAWVTKVVMVEEVIDAGSPPPAHVPFTFPFAAVAAAFDLPRQRVHLLDGPGRQIWSVGLTNGLAEGVFEFVHSPRCLALTPDGSRLFVGLASSNGQQGFVAEFQTEPLVKLRELRLAITPTSLVVTDGGVLVAGGWASNQWCVRASNLKTGSADACFPADGGVSGLTLGSSQDEVYVADGVWPNNSWRYALSPDGRLTNSLLLPRESGNGAFFPIATSGRFVRGGGEVCTLEGNLVTNLALAVLSMSADATNGTFVTTDGPTLSSFNQIDLRRLGGYQFAPECRFLATITGLVHAIKVGSASTILENRLLPALTPLNNRAPLVGFTVPTNNMVVQDGESVAVTITALDLDGDVTNVVLYADGEPLSMWSSQQATWVATPPGDHSLIAVARDNWGAASTSAPVRMHVNFPPTITLVNPPPDARFVVPATVVLAAEASDPDGRIARVDFYRNYALAATVTQPPFTWSFIESNLTYDILWAIATDDTGRQTSTPESWAYFIGLPGDNIADAFALGTVSQFATNVMNPTATRQKYEPLHAGIMGSNSLWWTWTAPANGSLVVSTMGSSFDTVLAVYTGISWPWYVFGGLSIVAANDDAPNIAPASRVKLNVTQSTSVFIAVDGANGASGEIHFQLDFQPEFAGGSNDFFAQRTLLTGPTNVLLADTLAATREAGEPNHAGDAGGRSLWWEWRPPGPGYATVSTEGSDFDTLLAVYQQQDFSSLSFESLGEVAANDDDPRGGRTSWLNFPCEDWRSYFIALDGYGNAGGQARLSIVWTHSDSQLPSNDSFTNAAPLSGSHAVANGSNLAATPEAGEPRHGGVGSGFSVWWRWSAPGDGRVALSTKGSVFDTVLAVYTGPRVEALTLVAANDDDPQGGSTSALEFEAAKGVTYWIAADGYAGSMGNVALSLQTRGMVLPPHLGTPRFKSGGLVEFDLSNESVGWVIVESSPDLQTWFPLSTNWLTGGGSVITVSQPALQTNQFYRVWVGE